MRKIVLAATVALGAFALSACSKAENDEATAETEAMADEAVVRIVLQDASQAPAAAQP